MAFWFSSSITKTVLFFERIRLVNLLPSAKVKNQYWIILGCRGENGFIFLAIGKGFAGFQFEIVSVFVVDTWSNDGQFLYRKFFVVNEMIRTRSFLWRKRPFLDGGFVDFHLCTFDTKTSSEKRTGFTVRNVFFQGANLYTVARNCITTKVCDYPNAILQKLQRSRSRFLGLPQFELASRFRDYVLRIWIIGSNDFEPAICGFKYISVFYVAHYAVI